MQGETDNAKGPVYQYDGVSLGDPNLNTTSEYISSLIVASHACSGTADILNIQPLEHDALYYQEEQGQPSMLPYGINGD